MSNDFGHWKTVFDSIPEDAIGFVYRITHKSSNKFYIGCKQLYSTIRKPPLKGKKRKRIVKKDSDWKKYTSSSGVIKEDIEQNKEDYEFEILSFHDSKSSLKIEEAKLIIENIYNPQCYNQIVNLRVRVNKSINNKEEDAQ
jgi:hypothetical protein